MSILFALVIQQTALCDGCLYVTLLTQLFAGEKAAFTYCLLKKKKSILSTKELWEKWLQNVFT